MDGPEDDRSQIPVTNEANNNETHASVNTNATQQITDETEADLSTAGASIEALRSSLTNSLVNNSTSQPPASNDAPSSPSSMRGSGLLARRQAAYPASPEAQAMNGNINIPDRPGQDDANVQLDHQRTRTQTPDPEQTPSGEGPLTPRNNAGPFVFDGSAGRTDGQRLVVPGIPEVTNGTHTSI